MPLSEIHSHKLVYIKIYIMSCDSGNIFYKIINETEFYLFRSFIAKKIIAYACQLCYFG